MSRSSRIVGRVAAVASLSTMLFIGSGGAQAATPTKHGCFGASVSALAAPSRPFGDFVSDTARNPEDAPGVGDAVQLVQAGNVPDAAFPNACN